ncbi:MAG: metallophosphoesterase family protein [Bacteroidales bacterium]
MKSRRNFVKSGLAASLGISLLPHLVSCKSEPLFRFAVCSDIHKDIMPDADKRLATFIKVASSYNANFIVQLGDFCYPTSDNKQFMSIWNSFAGNRYSVLGMHDLNRNTKLEITDFLNMPDSRYSFDVNGITFIILDTNFYKDSNGNFYDYSARNFMGKENLNQVPDIQTEWLRAKLEQTNNKCIIFSHYPLYNTQNPEINANVRTVLNSENSRAGYKKVIASFNGYTHADYSQTVNGITYVSINSMSNIWVGAKYSSTRRFTQLDNKNYPPLKYTIPYTLPLYAIVEIFKDRIRLIGTNSAFMKPTPLDMDMHSREDGFPLRPIISDLEISI